MSGIVSNNDNPERFQGVAAVILVPRCCWSSVPGLGLVPRFSVLAVVALESATLLVLVRARTPRFGTGVAQQVEPPPPRGGRRPSRRPGARRSSTTCRRSCVRVRVRA